MLKRDDEAGGEVPATNVYDPLGARRSTDVRRSPSSAPAASSGGFDFMKMIKMVLRRWYILLLLAFFGGAAGFFYAKSITPTYRAEAEIEMSVRRPRVVNSDVLFDDATSARDSDVIFNTRFAKFRSPAMEELASEIYFGKYPKMEYIQRPSRVGNFSLAHWVRKVDWWKDGQANIVFVSFVSKDPEFAARLVNVMTIGAGQLMMRENQAQSDGAVQWLLSQVEEQRGSLEGVERRLAELRQELQLNSLQQRREVLTEMQTSLTQEMTDLESRLASRKTLHAFVSSAKLRKENLDSLPPGVPKEEQLAELMTTWRAANDALLRAGDRFTKIHPQYQQAADAELRARRRLDRFIDRAAESVKNESDLLQQQLEQVAERIKKVERESLALDIKLADGTRQIQRLERERDAADASYQSILGRMEEARVAADENTAFVKVIREAVVPRIPISPDKKKIVGGFIFLAMLLGAGLVLVYEMWTDKIASVTDLKELGLTILGTMPRFKESIARGDLAMVGMQDKFSPMVEVFSSVNTTLNSNRYRHLSQVVLISSALPGEGKTISACNLAVSSANNGAKTLLIEGDLRRPRVAGIFETDEEKPSLLEWVAEGGKTFSHDQLVSANVIPNLDVITSHPLHDLSPAELLGRAPVRELMVWARANYERIIIDSPPLGVVGDGLVLADNADSVLLVSRVGVTRRRTMKFVLAHLREVDANVLGCIANDVPHSLAGMFSGGEGYGYGHNYESYING